jgi:hypothetical protein
MGCASQQSPATGRVSASGRQQFRKLRDPRPPRQTRVWTSARAPFAAPIQILKITHQVHPGVSVTLHRQQFVSTAQVLLEYWNAESFPKNIAIVFGQGSFTAIGENDDRMPKPEIQFG